MLWLKSQNLLSYMMNLPNNNKEEGEMNIIIRERKNNVAGWVNFEAFREPKTWVGKLLFKILPDLYEISGTYGAGNAEECIKKLSNLNTKPVFYKIEI